MMLVSCLILLHAGAGAWAGEKGMRVLFPPDQAVLESAVGALVIAAEPGSVDDLQVRVNNRRLKAGKKNYRQRTICFDGVELDFGLNEIKVVALKQGGKVDEAAVRVFRRSDISATALTPPGGFSRVFFHEASRERGCHPCHQTDLAATADGPENAPEKSPCHQCHKKLLSSFVTVHGPAAVWSCLSCHEVKGERKFAVVKPESQVCNGCHENNWSSMKFGHGPTAAGSCATCHDPHASDYPYFLRTGLLDICNGCHQEVLQKPHVIIGFSNSGHPVRKAVDPYNPNRPFTCVSCHNPHAGSSWVFLQKYDGVADISNFCRTCHVM